MLCFMGPVSWQVEEGNGQQHFELQSLDDCLQLAVERCALFFRKVQVHKPENMALLLSRLEATWRAQHKGSSSSSSSKGSSSSSKGISRHKGKRKHSSRAPSTPVHPCALQASNSDVDAVCIIKVHRQS